MLPFTLFEYTRLQHLGMQSKWLSITHYLLETQFLPIEHTRLSTSVISNPHVISFVGQMTTKTHCSPTWPYISTYHPKWLHILFWAQEIWFEAIVYLYFWNNWSIGGFSYWNSDWKESSRPRVSFLGNDGYVLQVNVIYERFYDEGPVFLYGGSPTEGAAFYLVPYKSTTKAHNFNDKFSPFFIKGIGKCP